MKRLIMILFIPILFGCATTSTNVASADNQIITSARGKLLNDIKEDLEGVHNAIHPSCKFIKILTAKPLTKEEDSTYEVWTIEACSGNQFIYEVEYSSDSEGNFVSVHPVDTNNNDTMP